MRCFLSALALLLILCSCKKDNEREPFNEITISGAVYDSTNRVGFSNALVRVSWPGDANSPYVLVDSFRTDAQGNFSRKMPLDFSRFNEKSLSVDVDIPEGYTSIYDLDWSTTGAGIGMGPERTNHIPIAPFIIYQKANLIIQLQQASNDNFSELGLYYGFYNFGRSLYWANFTNPKPAGNITYTVSTAAGLKNAVHVIKKFSSGVTTRYIDSIMVLPNSPNIITIPY